MKRTWPYDMWSVGITWLELTLATPHVFQIGERTRALLHHHLHLEGQPPVRALILPPMLTQSSPLTRPVNEQVQCARMKRGVRICYFHNPRSCVCHNIMGVIV